MPGRVRSGDFSERHLRGHLGLGGQFTFTVWGRAIQDVGFFKVSWDNYNLHYTKHKIQACCKVFISKDPMAGGMMIALPLFFPVQQRG